MSSTGADADLLALTIAEWMPGIDSWIEVMLMSVNPAARSPASYSAKDSAPAMQPT